MAAKIFLVWGTISFVMFALGPVLARFGVLAPGAGFLVFGLGALSSVPVFIAGAILTGKSGPMPGAIILVSGGIPALFLLYSAINARGIPSINDISTDRINPPPFTNALDLEANEARDMSFPGKNKSIIETSYPDIQPYGFNRSVDDVFTKALDIIQEEPGWKATYTAVGESESYIEGTATSGLFRFVDDFSIRITLVEEGGCVLDMRSKSRDGKGDIGVNAKRIRYFLERMRG